ncbi:RNA polymerase sigma factor SigI [Caloranaerobacter azorensis H53214]|uniref:RNA polymerase sigma factor SigI n=2 Tax=Caloranaerobacter azorensis TaxID=116090 RepID=A0A1M5S041_9FIRM|nr:RNA polymerase sigma-I factor [Caloranaerobacter azorensis]KGG80476.1 RNA polymerase sigma factor SigI [Caloranaerobacter azorensis H53214]SHH31850.1 RNA polymerase sigma factor [Caloranaerobacter azorensis DSM 13643]
MLFRKSLEDRVEKAKEDAEELNSLIKEYKPFIASTVQKKTGKFLRYGHDDELTIGMMAFKEAIESYDKSKGKFLNFAKMVISLRIIDYYRKKEKDKKIILFNEVEDNEENSSVNYNFNRAITIFRDREENEIRKLEIQEYKKELNDWGIDFYDLVKESPKQEKVRNLYKEIAKKIVEDKAVLQSLLSTRRLPIKEIQKIVPIHRKKLERGRKYIIAMVIVLIGDYQYIREYVDWR